MHKILARQQLSPNVTRLDVHAPRIAQIRRPGQFVIVHLAENSERIPLTIADANPDPGSIALVIQAVGKSTNELVALEVGDMIRDVAGPLGHPTEMIASGHALCIGGGVGTAVVHSIAQGLHRRGVRVTSIIGGRSKEWVIFEKELSRLGDVLVCTDDGSYGRNGFVTEAAHVLLSAGGVDIVYAVGPVPMMRAVAELTRSMRSPSPLGGERAGVRGPRAEQLSNSATQFNVSHPSPSIPLPSEGRGKSEADAVGSRSFGVRTIVSLNPVMIDGTGMCGGCRVSIGNEMKFACVDGPEFDGHLVNFDELQDRLATYREFEQRSLACAAGNCRLEKKISSES